MRAWTANTTAEEYFARGDIEGGTSILRKALEDLEIPAFWECNTLLRLAEWERYVGKPATALAVVARAEARLEKASAEADVRDLRGTGFGLRGRVYLEWGLLDLASLWFDREREVAESLALDVDRRRLVVSTYHRALHAVAVGNYEGLEELWKSALADEATYAEYPQERAKLLTQLGIGANEVERLDPNRPPRARALLEEALECPELGPIQRIKPELILADLTTRAGELDAAREHLERAALYLDGDEEAVDWPLHIALSAEVALAAGSSPAEFEGWRARLAASVEGMYARWRESEPRPGGYGFHQFAEARGPLSELIHLDLRVEPGPEGVQGAFERLVEVQTFGSLARRVHAKAPTLVELRAEILGRRSDHGVLCWLPGPVRTHLFVLDASVLEHHELPGFDTIEVRRSAFVRVFHRPLGEDRRVELDRLSLELRAALLPDSVLDRMRSWTRLSLVGLEFFGEVPFEAVPLDDGYVGTKLAVDVLPSLPFGLVLARRPSIESSDLDLALFAAPSVPPAARALEPSLSDIELSQERLETLADAYSPARTQLWTGSEATESQLAHIPTGTRVLQFLSHGVHDSLREGPPSAIALAPGESAESPASADGLLHAEESEALPATEVVVLTACAAARAPLRRGDAGAADLGGGFLTSGARAVVLSAFDLELEAALRLSGRLHEGLRAGETPAEALRAARAELAGDPRFADPGYYGLVRVFGYGHRAVFPAPQRVTPNSVWIALAALLATSAGWVAVARSRRRDHSRART